MKGGWLHARLEAEYRDSRETSSSFVQAMRGWGNQAMEAARNAKFGMILSAVLG